MDRLSYDPNTGIFTRRVLCGGHKAGTIAGTLHWKGYVYVRLGNKKYYAHRLAFLYMTGSIPEQIDHIDCVRHNNRWNNLRVANGFINAQNRRHIKGVTNLIGASPKHGRFCAQIGITVEGKKIKKHLGMFDTPEDAHYAYVQAKRALHDGCTI